MIKAILQSHNGLLLIILVFLITGCASSGGYIKTLQQSPSVGERQWAASELAKQTTNMETIIPALINALNDPSYTEVSEYGAGAVSASVFGGITPHPGATPLNVIRDYPVREAATESLSKLTGQSFGTDKEKWTQWWEKNKERFR